MVALRRLFRVNDLTPQFSGKHHRSIRSGRQVPATNARPPNRAPPASAPKALTGACVIERTHTELPPILCLLDSLSMRR